MKSLDDVDLEELESCLIQTNESPRVELSTSDIRREGLINLLRAHIRKAPTKTTPSTA